ncbi:MAG: hypothetical protein ACI9O4_000669 [Chitinophagales bacterium]|jgi:hypothetical protein
MLRKNQPTPNPLNIKVINMQIKRKSEFLKKSANLSSLIKRSADERGRNLKN